MMTTIDIDPLKLAAAALAQGDDARRPELGFVWLRRSAAGTGVVCAATNGHLLIAAKSEILEQRRKYGDYKPVPPPEFEPFGVHIESRLIRSLKARKRGSASLDLGTTHARLLVGGDPRPPLDETIPMSREYTEPNWRGLVADVFKARRRKAAVSGAVLIGHGPLGILSKLAEFSESALAILPTTGHEKSGPLLALPMRDARIAAVFMPVDGRDTARPINPTEVDLPEEFKWLEDAQHESPA